MISHLPNSIHSHIVVAGFVTQLLYTTLLICIASKIKLNIVSEFEIFVLKIEISVNANLLKDRLWSEDSLLRRRCERSR